MAHLNINLALSNMVIDGAWRPLVSTVDCNSVELTGDVAWEWCSDIETDPVVSELHPTGLSYTLVRSTQQLVQNPTSASALMVRCAVKAGEQLCYVKASNSEESGLLYIKTGS